MRVLVTGGAGYIGSHVVRELINAGHRVTVLDNLSTGHEEAIDPRATFIVGSISNHELLLQRFHAHQIEAVVHLAGSSHSKDPFVNYHQNFSCSLNLYHAAVKAGIKKILLSSSASVYGIPQKIPITEGEERRPTNTHGRSKMMAEMALEDFQKAYHLGATILRYYNVAGSSLDASIGEDHFHEPHIIPRILHAAQDEGEVVILGDQYNTPDGTMIRDYIHVLDLVRAHVLALEHMNEGELKIYNVSNEHGYSVRDIIMACEDVTNKKVSVKVNQEHRGESPILIADSQKIQKELQWRPIYQSIHTIVEHAWHWHSTHPGGYSGSFEIPFIPTSRNLEAPPRFN